MTHTELNAAPHQIISEPSGDDAELMHRVYAEALRCGRDPAFYVFHTREAQ